MAALILSPTNCEIPAVIRFLQAQKQPPAEIHRRFCHVYGPNIMSDSMVRRCCGQFTKFRTNVHVKDRSGGPSLVTSEMMANVRQAHLLNQRFTISELSSQFPRNLITAWISQLAGNNISAAIFSKRSAITTDVGRLKLHWIIPICSLSIATHAHSLPTSHTISGRGSNLLDEPHRSYLTHLSW